MRSFKGIFFLSLFVVAGMIACKKDQKAPHPTSGYPEAPAVSLSKSTIKRGEPLVASVQLTAASNPVVRWTVNPGANSILSSSAATSTILFSNSGRYTITANYYADSAASRPYDSSSSPVSVNDSIYTDTMVAHCNALIYAPVASGDLLTLMPIYNKDTGLIFVALTQKTYPDVPSIEVVSSGTAGSFHFTIKGITEYPCVFNTSPGIATGVLSLGNPPNGTYPVSIDLGNTTYSGTMNVSATTISFNWNYTAGIVIAPSQVNK